MVGNFTANSSLEDYITGINQCRIKTCLTAYKLSASL